MLVLEVSNHGSKERLSQTPHKKHLVKVNLLIKNVKDELQLNDSICEEIKYLYEKAFSKGYPRRLGHGKTKRHFYLTECVGACIYLVPISRGKKYVDFHDRKKRSITTKQVQNQLNSQANRSPQIQKTG